MSNKENENNVVPSMDSLIAVYECLDCDVLAKNMVHTNKFNIEIMNHFTGNEIDNFKFDFGKLANLVDNSDESEADFYISKLEQFHIYDASFESLSLEYGFPKSEQKACKFLLNLAAYIYLTLYGKVWMKMAFPAFEKELVKLVNAAERFQYYLQLMTEWDEGINQLFDNQPIHQMLNQTKDNLNKIVKLKEQFRLGTIGKTANLDKRAPTGNPGLDEFIKLMWAFWHDLLGRTIIQKYDGINGRKEFLEFLIACLRPVHPTLIEGYSGGGRVDNALKKFQRSLKSNES